MKPALLAIFFLAACASAPKLSPQDRERLGALWEAYQKDDASWPAKRDAALADPLASDFLIQNLIREVVRGTDQTASTDISRSPRAVRARAELAQIGAPALPLLIGLFSTKDPGVAAICSEVAASMGEKASAELLRALESQDSKIRRWALHALSSMEPPQGADRIAAALKGDREWFVRGAAAQEIVRCGAGAARPALEGALQDPDSFVRRTAAEALGNLRERAAIPALIAYLRFAVGKEDFKEIEAALQALRASSKMRFGPDASLWQTWWEGSRKNS